MVIAQALVEHGVLDSFTAGMGRLFDQVSYYVEQPWFMWFAGAVILVLAWFFFRK